ncbi:MAG: site-specific DNA-methyltransferase [Bacteroidales bacterium]|nr:site-specific DNA-methyltransferase [Bacteroidales bacterium]
MKLQNNWINGDCIKELKKIPDKSVQLIITSPPYHNLRVYSNDPCDLSNCESYEEYYYLLGLVIAECERILVPGGKFIIQYEDYNYTLGRDGKNGQESLTGAINEMFLNNGFSLWTKAFWRKYSAQRAMLAQGNLYYRNMKARDTILAANVGFVYVYKKQGDLEVIKGSDITLAEWAEWADGVWNIPNSGIGHTTPFAEELVKRCIKLWSCPGDTVLDPFAGCGTVNKVAIENGRNAIGIELNLEFYDLANEKRFSKWNEDVFESDDSIEKMKERFAEQLAIGKAQSEAAKAEKARKKAEREAKKLSKNTGATND